jgi:hypothetical protein
MAQIHNSDLSKELIKGGRLQVSRDIVPNQLAEKVVPVMEVNPRLLKTSQIVRGNTATNATSATIYTTPTDRDFYLTGASIAVIKDVTSTSTESSIKVTIDGSTQRLLSISGITLTAQSSANSINFQNPIKIDRNTTIIVTNTANTANINAWGNIVGYVDDVSNA